MSNDLISRKALMKIFSETIDGRRMPEYDCDGFPITLSLSEIKKFIRQAPTAYDVDSACEELTKLKNAEVDMSDKEPELTDVEDIYDAGRSQGRIEAFSMAIDIARNGGINEK